MATDDGPARSPLKRDRETPFVRPPVEREASYGHDQLVQEAFSRQAPAFEDPRRNRIFTVDSSWLLQRLILHPDDLLLDVAAGTGHAARSLAPRVLAAVAVDVTAGMLATGKEQADAAGLGNVLFMRGRAEALPFLDGSFDVVITRFALHHVEDADAVIGELARCLRAGGRLAIADMVASEQPALAGAQDRLERLRDPSHMRLLSVAELRRRMGAHGLLEISAEARDIERPLAPWLEVVEADSQTARSIEDRLRGELRGGPPTGLRPREHDGELRFVQNLASLMATKPA